jgi:hypothetical protein
MADNQNLIELHFQEIANWELVNGKIKYVVFENIQGGCLNIKNILYSFVQENPNGETQVMYIGKTTKGIIKRLNQYRSGSGTATNSRVNSNINRLLNSELKVKVFILADIPALQWGGYNLNLAAALEDDLIIKFKPEWNNTHGVFKSSLEELEDDNLTKEDYTGDNKIIIQDCNNPLGVFDWKLGSTYYNLGFMNPGVKCDTYFGDQGEIVTLEFKQFNKIFQSIINRQANANGTVRLSFGEAVYFIKQHYTQGDTIQVNICDKNKLIIN